jgi:hypothetical protein
MVYRLSIPNKKKNIISILDAVILTKEVSIPNAPTARVLGMYTKKWRHDGIISLYTESMQKKTILKLNVPGVEKNMKRGKRVEYLLNLDVHSVRL